MSHHPFAALAALLLSLPGAAGEALAPADDLARFLSWFEGEWDNHEQHWQQKQVERREKPIEHIHHVFRAVHAPAIGGRGFHVRQYFDNDPDRLYRLRFYRFDTDPDSGAIRLQILRYRDEATWRDPEDERFAELTPEALEARPGCEVYWTWQGDHYQGSMREGACRFVSERFGGKEIVIRDRLRLGEDELWIHDLAVDRDGNRVFGDPDGPPHVNRKVRFYQGWAAVRAGGASGEGEWIGVRDLVLHNEGDRLRLVDGDGKPLGYAVELARLTYQNTRQPILKLALIDEATGKTLGYAWTAPLGERIGLNLGFLQAGFTLSPDPSGRRPKR